MMKGVLRFTIATVLAGCIGAESSFAVSLDDCIRTALKDNPDAQAAARRVESARAAIREAESAYYPQLTLSGTYARTDNPPQAFMMELNQRILNMRDPAFDPNNPDDTENLRAGIGAKMRVLDGGQRGLYRDMAKLGTDALKAQEEAIRNELVYQVTRGYYGVLQAQAFVNVQKGNDRQPGRKSACRQRALQGRHRGSDRRIESRSQIGAGARRPDSRAERRPTYDRRAQHGDRPGPRSSRSPRRKGKE